MQVFEQRTQKITRKGEENNKKENLLLISSLIKQSRFRKLPKIRDKHEAPEKVQNLEKKKH